MANIFAPRSAEAGEAIEAEAGDVPVTETISWGKDQDWRGWFYAWRISQVVNVCEVTLW